MAFRKCTPNSWESTTSTDMAWTSAASGFRESFPATLLEEGPLVSECLKYEKVQLLEQQNSYERRLILQNTGLRIARNLK